MQLVNETRDFPGTTRGPIDHRLPGGVTAPGSAEHEDTLVADGAMKREKLEVLIKDCEMQPPWRAEADINAAYYDNYQTTPEMQRRAKETGQPLSVVNLIARSVNSMLGQEAKSRTSWKVSAESGDQDEVADVVGYKLTEAQRETYADMAISEAYASQVKAGLGWVEVSRNPDPWADYQYRVECVHRNEIWWDFRDTTSLSLRRARWLVRKRWLDIDDAIAEMPQFKDIFERYSNNGWNDSMMLTGAMQTDGGQSVNPTTRQWLDHTQFSVNRGDWYDNGRKRIMFYEVWYRVKVAAVALVVDNARTVEFDPKNPMHQLHLRTGSGKLVKAPKTVLRMAMFAGPHRLMDVETKKTNFPYIPFWAFREDETKAPYGPVSGMRYPQDEYNARRSRLMWLIQSVQAFVDRDALATEFNTVADLANNIKRPDALFITNEMRRNGQHAIDIRRDINLPQEQIEVMNDAKQLIQDQPGLTQPMVGSQSGMSGVAMSGLLEQGMTAMGDLNDNYAFARKLVGEALVELILEDIGAKVKSFEIGIGAGRRTIVLNAYDPKTQGITNDVSMTSIKTSLSETPSTPSYKLMEQNQLMQVMQAAAGVPDAIQMMLPEYVESTSLPNRMAMARFMRQKWGMPDPSDRAGSEDAQAQASQQQAEAAANAKAIADADVLHKQSLANLDNSSAQLNQVKAQHLNADIGLKATQAQSIDRNDAISQQGQMTTRPGPGPTPSQDDLIRQAIQEASIS